MTNSNTLFLLLAATSAAARPQYIPSPPTARPSSATATPTPSSRPDNSPPLFTVLAPCIALVGVVALAFTTWAVYRHNGVRKLLRLQPVPEPERRMGGWRIPVPLGTGRNESSASLPRYRPWLSQGEVVVTQQ